MTPLNRLAACEVLRAQNIPYVHWYEDALRYHGSTTVLFSVFLLVNNPEETASNLCAAGWAHAAARLYTPTYYDASVDRQAILSNDPDNEDDSRVVLISAHTWPGITPTHDDDHFPTLPQLYNALVQRFLDTNDDGFRRYLTLQISYLYLDCKQLAYPDFADELPYEIRQFHLDYLSKTLQMAALGTIAHERMIRERARKGDWTLLPGGSAELGGTRPDRELEARLLASIRARNAAYSATSEDEPYENSSLSESISDA